MTQRTAVSLYKDALWLATSHVLRECRMYLFNIFLFYYYFFVVVFLWLCLTVTDRQQMYGGERREVEWQNRGLLHWALYKVLMVETKPWSVPQHKLSIAWKINLVGILYHNLNLVIIFISVAQRIDDLAIHGSGREKHNCRMWSWSIALEGWMILPPTPRHFWWCTCYISTRTHTHKHTNTHRPLILGHRTTDIRFKCEHTHTVKGITRLTCVHSHCEV